MTPAFLAKSSLIIFSLVSVVPISTNAGPVKVMHGVSSDGLFTLVQTGGMMRRQEGAIGMDKRKCKQQRRQQRS